MSRTIARKLADTAEDRASTWELVNGTLWPGHKTFAGKHQADHTVPTPVPLGPHLSLPLPLGDGDTHSGARAGVAVDHLPTSKT